MRAILSLIPLFVIGWNIWKILSYYMRLRRFIRVSAKVVNTSVKGSRGRTYFYTPIIEFTTVLGEKYTLEYTEDNPDRPLYRIGEQIKICYDPEEPRRFMIYDPKAEYLLAIVWIIIGLGVFYLM